MKRTLAGLLLVFYATQLASLVITLAVTAPGSEPGRAREPKVDYLEGGDTIGSSLYIYVFLMVGAVFIALAMKFNLGRLLFRSLESAIIFLSVFLFLFSMFPGKGLLWVIPGLLAAAAKRIFSHWLLASGLSVFIAAVVGSILGASLSPLPILALMGFLSIYDVVAVKLSGHMQSVVDHVQGTRSSFLIEIPGMKSAVGISDLAVPSMLVASSLITGSLALALATALGGALGLAVAILTSHRAGMVPALPFIFCGCIAVYLPVSSL